MKAQVSSAVVLLGGIAAFATGAHAGPSPDATATLTGAPRIEQMVVFRSGAAIERRVSAKRATAKVGDRLCSIAARTPMATLLRADPGPIRFRDYGNCSRRAADGVGLFVTSIRGERNRGQDGWVYKVGRELGTAGAADPAGPFGDGRLKAGQRVLWLYCRQRSTGSCQRSLEIDTSVDGRELAVKVTGYDDGGNGVAVAGATAIAGDERATTDGEGGATLTLKPGSYRVRAAKRGAIRSFSERVTIE
ncbi:MAG TPA: hypothetical protein VHF90_02910 [Thermoleophilaceae bacterium]|nr:hypothetical protein [Thermoleophilaceae bacterium]